MSPIGKDHIDSSISRVLQVETSTLGGSWGQGAEHEAQTYSGGKQ